MPLQNDDKNNRMLSMLNVEEIIKNTQSQDQQVREEAVDLLGQLATPDAIDTLLMIIKDKAEDRSLRRKALWSLRMIGDEAVIQPLAEILKDEGYPDSSEIIFVIGDIGGERAAKVLLDILQSSDENLKFFVASALGNVGDMQAIPSLTQLYRSTKNMSVKAEVALALGKLHDKHVIPFLIALLKDSSEDENRRKDAAEVLGDLREQEAIQPLIEVLNDKSSLIKHSAILALRKLASKQATPALVRVLIQDEDENNRYAAAYALGKVGEGQAIQPLLETLSKDEDVDTRFAAASAISELNKPEAVAPLLKILTESGDLDTQLAAVAALGNLKDKQTIEAIEKFKAANVGKVPDFRIEISTDTALYKLGKEEALQALLTLLNNTNPDIRKAALWALGDIGKTNLKDKEKVLESLIKMLKDNNEDVVRNTSYVLGNLGDAQALPSLELLKRESLGKSYLIKIAAADAIKNIEKAQKQIS